MTKHIHRHFARTRKWPGDLWLPVALAVALFSGVLYAAHPVVHPGLDFSHDTHSQSSVPDHCTLCQPNHEGMPAGSAAPLPATFDPAAPTPLLYVSPLRNEEPTAGSISPRAPPFAHAN